MNEQKQEISSSISSQLKAEAGLKRVFNPEQKSYFIKLKEEMRTIANGRTALEMHAEKDLKSLREWTERRRKVIEFLATKKIPASERNKTVAGQIEMAREKLGAENVLGPEEVEKTFGIQLEAEEIPEIPFSEEELEKAAELGQMLVLRVDKTSDGKPLTLEAMNNILVGTDEEPGKWKKQGKASLLNQMERWKILVREKYSKETPRSGWALVSKEILPESTGKDYIKQTEVIVEYIKDKVFEGMEMPEEYAEAIAEFESEKERLTTLMRENWQEASKQLSGLKITQLTRQTAQEAIYDLAMYFDANNKQLLTDTYIWSASMESRGSFVYVGGFDASGVSGDGWDPDKNFYIDLEDIGVSFSRLR